jgi:uncharacterized membrane protein YeiB
MSGLTFAWQGHEVVFMACTAAQTVSTSALQRVLLSFLCLLFAGKEACAAYTLRLSPRCEWHYVLTSSGRRAVTLYLTVSVCPGARCS